MKEKIKKQKYIILKNKQRKINKKNKKLKAQNI